jgi:dTDP-4-amino-4,6-dideoxygalactose transaminase
MIPHARPVLTDTHTQAVLTALRHCQLSQGPQVATLEKTLTERYPDRRAVAVSSGTAALYVALTLLDLPAGSDVIIPSYTCNALFCAVSHAGLKPVCADVGEGTVVITAQTVKEKITANTGAIIAPHTFGVRAPIEQIQALGLPVIEDCAQALGGHNPDGTLLGSTGDLAVLSFYATKPIPGGEGGVVLLPSEWEQRARALRDCDEAEPDPRAFNFKMSDIHAALINSTLAGLETMRERRNRLADRFDARFGNVALHQRLNNSETPQTLCFRYLIQTSLHAATLIAKFEACGIQARRPIWKPLHLSTGETCPNTDILNQTLTSVPLFPDLTESEIEEILASGQKIIGDLT